MNNYFYLSNPVMERKIYNPIQKDQVIFLKTHADTNGEFTLVEVELALAWLLISANPTSPDG